MNVCTVLMYALKILALDAPTFPSIPSLNYAAPTSSSFGRKGRQQDDDWEAPFKSRAAAARASNMGLEEKSDGGANKGGGPSKGAQPTLGYTPMDVRSRTAMFNQGGYCVVTIVIVVVAVSCCSSSCSTHMLSSSSLLSFFLL